MSGAVAVFAFAGAAAGFAFAFAVASAAYCFRSSGLDPSGAMTVAAEAGTVAGILHPGAGLCGASAAAHAFHAFVCGRASAAAM